MAFYCENDGGTQYRPERALTVSRSSLVRPLRQNRALGGIAAFVAFVRARTPHGEVVSAKAAPAFPLVGDVEGDGVIDVVVAASPSEAGGCRDELPELQVEVWGGSARGAPLRCCGP